jgi:hypothetical protein
MSQRAQQQTFRPRVEALEGRCLPAPIPFRFLGVNTPGPWFAGSERIYFFAIEFRGTLTASHAHTAWIQGLRKAEAGDFSLDTTDQVSDRTTFSRHFLIGWDNLDEHQGGYIAADYAGQFSLLVNTGGYFNPGTSVQTHTLSNWFSNDGSFGRHFDGWVTKNFDSNGYHFSLSVVPDASGDILGSFTAPS